MSKRFQFEGRLKNFRAVRARRRHSKGRRLALTLAACLAASGLLSASAGGLSIVPTSPSPRVSLIGETSPSKLPDKTPTPIRLNWQGTISSPESPEEPPPALKSLSLRFDKNGAIFTKGLPICPYLRPVIDINVVRACRPAIIGHGVVELEIKLPEQPAFLTEGPLTIYNGKPKDGHPVLIYLAYAHIPAATTFFTYSVIESDHGKFGTKTTIPIPKIVSGNGSLTAFRATIGRTWMYRGKRVSLLSARCPKGVLAAQGEFGFVNGETASGEVTEHCG